MPGRLSARLKKSQEGHEASVQRLPVHVPKMSDLDVVQFIRDRFDSLEHRHDNLEARHVRLESTLNQVHDEVKETNGRVTAIEQQDRWHEEREQEQEQDQERRRVRRSDEIRGRINAVLLIGGAFIGGSMGYILHTIFG